MWNMKCLKCGRETGETFCNACLADMEKYPVKPGSIVLFPKERTAPKKAPPRHPVVSPETTIENQRKLIRRLIKSVAALLILLVLTGFALFRMIQENSKPQVGKNYSTVTKPAEESTNDTTIIMED